MTSSVDQLLLTSSQLAEVERMKRAFRDYQKKGDAAGMEWAHAQAEKIRANAGYSGGADGSEYKLLPSEGETPAGYGGYEALLQRYGQQGMAAITANYEQAAAELEKQRAELEEKGEQNQAAARSAAWNRQRLADAGLLTRGVSQTGISDVITATYLNQAAANAYQALLDTEESLRENDAARLDARADALTDAAELQKELGAMLGEGYLSLLEQEEDRNQDLLLQELKQQAQSDLSTLEFEQKQKEKEQDYFYDLALQQLKRQWALEDARAKR